MGAGLAARRLARALLQDAWPNASGGLPCAIQSTSYSCRFDKRAALAAAAASLPKRRDRGSNGVSTQVLVIVLVVCTVLTVVCVAGTLWALHRRHRRIEAQRRRVERRRQREKDEAAGNQLRQVVIPVIVLGPCGEQLQVAFDDGYLEQLAAEAAAAECPECDGSAAAGPAACDNAPASADGSFHGGGSSSSSSAAVSISGGSVVEQPAEQQADIAAPAPSQPSSSDSTGTPAAAASAAAPHSLMQRVTCPASRSVLSVADVAALYSRADC